MRLRPPRPDRTAADPAALPRTVTTAPAVTPGGPDDPHRPAHWDVPRGIRTASEWAWRGLVIGAAAVAVLYLTNVLSEVVIPILVALLLAALLQPVYAALTRIVPRGLAAGITVIGTLAMVFGLLSFVGSQLTSQIDDIGAKVGDGIDQIRQWLNTTFGVTDRQLEGYIDQAREWLSSGTLDRRGGLGGPHGDAHRGRLLPRDVLPLLLPLRRPAGLGVGGAAVPDAPPARRCTPRA